MPFGIGRETIQTVSEVGVASWALAPSSSDLGRERKKAFQGGHVVTPGMEPQARGSQLPKAKSPVEFGDGSPLGMCVCVSLGASGNAD